MPYPLKIVIASLLREIREGLTLYDQHSRRPRQANRDYGQPARPLSGDSDRALRPREAECALRIAIVDLEKDEGLDPSQVEALRRAVEPVTRELASAVTDFLMKHLESAISGDFHVSSNVKASIRKVLEERISSWAALADLEQEPTPEALADGLSKEILPNTGGPSSPLAAVLRDLHQNFDELLREDSALPRMDRELQQRNSLINQLLERAPEPSSLAALVPDLRDLLPSTLSRILRPHLTELRECLAQTRSDLATSTVWVEIGASRLASLPGAVSTLHLAATAPEPTASASATTRIESSSQKRGY